MERVGFKNLTHLKKCVKCERLGLEYWDRTEEEVIYKCKYCQSYVNDPFNKDELNIYFSF